MSREEQFTRYVEARWSRLVTSAVLLGCSQADAEDLVQATLERCLVHWSKVERAEDRDAYVHRMLINGFLSARRRRWRDEVPTAVMPDVGIADPAALSDVLDSVVRALNRLAVPHRTVVVLRFYAHLSVPQIAAALGVREGTVKSRLSRSLAHLADDPHLAGLRGGTR